MTGRDHELLERARRVLPGITQTYSKAPDQQVEGVYPVFLERGSGCRVWDIDGNAYIDYPCALGPVILGYGDEAVDAAVMSASAEGRRSRSDIASKWRWPRCSSTQCPARRWSDFSRPVRRQPPPRYAWHGRPPVASTSRCAGITDGTTGRSVTASRSAGVPFASRALTHQWTYNDLDSLRAVFSANPSEIAVVIMEPVGVEPPVPGFLETVLALAHEHGALLVFDEVITGFRLAPGGAQEYFGVIPDLAVFGKAMANGYPLAAVAGRAAVMEQIASTTFISSTFGGDTVALAAALATMRRIREGGVIEHLWRQGARLTEGFNALASEYEVPARMIGLAPRRVIVFEAVDHVDANSIKGLVWQECLDRGVLLGNANFVSLAHDDGAVDATLEALTVR